MIKSEWVCERRVFERKKKFAGKVTKIAKVIVRMVAFEGSQPVITEAFLKGDNVQCEMDAVKKSNEEWKFWNFHGHCVQYYWFCSRDLCTLQDLQTL